MDKITVIIPVYNRAATLARAIESVLIQNDPLFECIVIDDGSNDNSASIARSYPRIRLIQTENRGVSAARNTGIQASEGTYIAFLDSDDQWLPGKLDRDREYLQQENSCRIFQSNEIWVRNGIRVNSMTKHAKKTGDIFKESLFMCMVSPSSLVAHHSIFEQYGYFDENLPVCEDYDLWLRIGLYEPFGLIETPAIIKYGGHEDQLSRSRWGMDRFRLYSLLKLYNGLMLQHSKTEQLKQVIEEIRRKMVVLQKGAQKRDNKPLLKTLLAIEAQISECAMCTDFSSLLQ